MRAWETWHTEAARVSISGRRERVLWPTGRRAYGRAMKLARSTLRRAVVAVLVVLLAAATAHAGELLKLDLSSPLVDTTDRGAAVTDGPRPLYCYVRLPDGYDVHKGRRYPVLWLCLLYTSPSPRD